MNSQEEEWAPQTKPSFSGGPPRPPKITAQDLEDQPGDPGKVVYLLDPMVVRDLAAAIGLKPFVVIADLLELRLFKRPDDMVDFETAAAIARKHGYQAQRPPPGISPEEILAKAKELGISAARVASSTLDKITAEFLEEQLLLLRTDLRAEQPTLPPTPLVASEPAPQPAPPPPHISVTAPVLAPKTQPSFSGGPPRPPKITAQDLEDQPGDPGKVIYLLDPMVVRDLATALGLKPFVVIADLLELKLFKRPDDMVEFTTASVIARKHGYRAQLPPPGMLIL